jgi:hypothetical protein
MPDTKSGLGGIFLVKTRHNQETFPGLTLELGENYLAKNCHPASDRLTRFWAPMKTKRPKEENPGEPSVPIFMEKPKRGRPTIPDNFLQGARNEWAALLEETWPEIGWSLLSVESRADSTIDDVHEAFDPVRHHLHNLGLAEHFYRKSFEVATPTDVCKNGRQLEDLQAEIIKIQAKQDELHRACLNAGTALRNANPSDKEAIQEAGRHRQESPLHTEDLEKLQTEHDALDRKLRDQEAYVYRSELLDFLRSGRYAVNPNNLANALAGLPLMKWRQSFLRCSGMPHNLPRSAYSIFEVLAEIWGRRSKEFEGPLEFFRAELLKLSKEKFGYTRQFLYENWRDLRLAIEECWRSKYPAGQIPFVLASTFLRNATRQKDAAERILSEQESLEV